MDFKEWSENGSMTLITIVEGYQVVTGWYQNPRPQSEKQMVNERGCEYGRNKELDDISLTWHWIAEGLQ